jgi:NAD(P)-dependent dehydrogenase (short-subunit alcohol dehydrogenase family)
MISSSSAIASLEGKLALVTGAGKRIGRTVALRLAREGADVVVHYHSSRAEADEAVSEIKKLGRKSIALQADLRSVAEIRRLVQQVETEFGRLDILVNNAANFIPGHVEDTTEEIWDAALDANLKGVFFCAQAAAPLLKKSRGVIVNFGDVGGVIAWPGYIAHCVSKAGVVMLTKCLAKALAPEVRVSAIAPGTITMAGDPSELEREFVQRAPLRRTGTPEEVAEAVMFLVRSTFMTGQVLLLEGGRTL